MGSRDPASVETSLDAARTSARATWLLIALAALCRAQQLHVGRVEDDVIKARFEKGAVGARDRQRTIREIFEEAGCSPEEQRIDRSSSNVVCTLPGETDSTIVVGGHFDFAERGQGMIDDWSGTALLPSLYQALKAIPRRHTYVFIAFTKEELGLVGSAAYVRALTKEQKGRIRAFVNLECLGLAPVKVWVSRSTRSLVDRLVEVATATSQPIQGMNVERVGDDDTHPFLNAHIPVISIHSLTQDTFRILHSIRDRPDVIHLDEYLAAYRLVALYLAYLDAKVE